MPYFSRLTDIVTCNLSSILDKCDDPRAALAEIIREMSEGVAGAERSVRTAGNNVARIESEIGEQRSAADRWLAQAQQALKDASEEQARLALTRKHEVEDLIAGLEQQLQAAVATRNHLSTMLSAIQARFADAHRRLRELDGEALSATAVPTVAAATVPSTPDRAGRIEAELERMKQQLHRGSP